MKTSITLAFSLAVINGWLIGLFNGFSRGYDYNFSQYKECRGMGFSGETIYEALANYHTSILLILLIFIILKYISNLKYINKGILSEVFCLLLLFLTLFKYYQWYKQTVNTVNYEDQFYNLLRETITLYWLSISSTVVLIALETKYLITKYLHHDTQKTEYV